MKSLEQKIVCKTYTLSNGLTVWLNEDHNQPKVFGAVVVKAGAKDCPDTGIAHYFEHMMFKGTDKIGTTDYAAEKVFLDQIADKYDELGETDDPKLRADIQAEINRLSIQASEFVIPNEFDRLISRYGGTKLNAGTSADFTSYYNVFSPQYMRQWAEINSERFLNPVFRLFQSELETVYEEKNMYGDYVGGLSVERLKERYFKDHPYAYPIIGSTENLKNPSLKAMRRFFETYYVASNMGLILCGDFQIETTLPIVEEAFSRIPRGGEVPRFHSPLPEFKGRELFHLKVPVPFVKMMALGFRGVPANHPDEAALKVAVALLNNGNGTGYLDKLVVEHKVLAASVINEQMNEAGILAIIVMPRLLFQSYAAAEKLVWGELNRLKEGDFTEEFFQSLKLELKRNYMSMLEDIGSRAQLMMRVYSQGKTWEEYLEEVKSIDTLTKEDIIRVAGTYFTEDYLLTTKKTGRYPKDDLPKPDYIPVIPKQGQTSSAYARELATWPVEPLEPRFLDETSNGMQVRDLTPFVTLYTTENPVNDLFSLDMLFSIGTIVEPHLLLIANYLQQIGTDKYSFSEFRTHLQMLGSTLSFEANERNFVVRVTGFEANFRQTLELVAHFLAHAKADKKKIHHLIDEAKVIERSFHQSSESIARAVAEKMAFGENSAYLRKLSLAEIKQLKGEELIRILHEVMTYACDLHYCGTLPTDEVEALLRHFLPLKKVKRASVSPCFRPLETYEQPCVFFVDKADVSQSIICGFVPGEPVESQRDRFVSRLFSNYFGGDMSSILFQEIREFRSFAYRVNGRYQLPFRQYPDQPGYFRTTLSTQSDKTIDALSVLDALLRDMPVKPEKLEPVKQAIRNEVNGSYPGFRDISLRWAFYRKEGFHEDPNRLMLQLLDGIGMDDLVQFYDRQLKGHPAIYAVVGNKRKIDMEKLAAFGEIIYLKEKDFYR